MTWKEQYPFKENFLKLKHLKMHFVNEGNGDPILMLHGNPTWSFFYRNLIKEFSINHQVIAPDHIGCGLSDKPQNYEYILENHIQNIEKLVDHLSLKNITLVVHDWGGAIGFGFATRHPELIKKIVIMNTAAFTSSYIAPQINICRIPILGELVIRGLNAFAWPATFMAVENKLDQKTKDGFLYPYDNYSNRIATAKFVKDIPMSETHISYKTLKDIENKLELLKCPKLILWGKKDFCFNDYFLHRWNEIYPNDKVVELPNAGHYLIEDEQDEVIKEIKIFLGE